MVSTNKFSVAFIDSVKKRLLDVLYEQPGHTIARWKLTWIAERKLFESRVKTISGAVDVHRTIDILLNMLMREGKVNGSRRDGTEWYQLSTKTWLNMTRQRLKPLCSTTSTSSRSEAPAGRVLSMRSAGGSRGMTAGAD
jgi:hypothetical protein